MWYSLSLTGGIYGGAVIILLLLIFLLMHFKKNSRKIRNVYFFIAVILLAEILISASTLYFLKDIFQNPRPSQSFFIQKGLIENGGSEYFAMTPEEKRNYLLKRLSEDKSKVEEVYPPILDSWVNETVYSFPSGHAQTAFFLGTILAFVIYRTSSKRLYVFIPLLWAILVAVSRVVIGIHYPADVSAGALIGLIVAFIVMSLKKVNLIFE